MKAMKASEAGTLYRVHIFSTVILAVMIAGAWYIFSWHQAMSVMIGGLIAIASFALLSRDVIKMIDSVARAANPNGVKRMAKVRMLFNFYLRLGVIALVLYALNTRVPIDMIGLAAGLSTVMLSVVIVVLSKGSTLNSTQRLKGA